MENSAREVEQQCPGEEGILIKSVTLSLLCSAKAYEFSNKTQEIMKDKKTKHITLLRNCLQTTSLVTWNSAEGILLMFNLDFLSNSTVYLKKQNKKNTHTYKETFVKTLTPVNVHDSTKTGVDANSPVVRFGFGLCPPTSLHAKAVS